MELFWLLRNKVKIDKLEISYDGYVGWQNVYKMPDLLNAQEYMAMQDEILFNEGQAMNNWESLLGSRVYGMLQNGWKGTDWFDAIREKNAMTQNHAINLTGGNEMSKFSMGFSYTTKMVSLVNLLPQAMTAIRHVSILIMYY